MCARDRSSGTSPRAVRVRMRALRAPDGAFSRGETRAASRRTSRAVAASRGARARDATARRRRVAIGLRRDARRRGTTRALFEVFPSGPPGGDPSEWTLLAASAASAVRDAAAFAASALGVGAATRAQRDRKLEAEERTRREFGFVDVVTGDGGGDGRGLSLIHI